MASREQRLLFGSAAVCTVLVLGAVLGGLEQHLAFAAPLLILVVPLIAGRYLGEECLTRLIAKRRRQRALRSRSADVPAFHRRELGSLVRGGRLIATSLAVRPPPVSAGLSI